MVDIVAPKCHDDGMELDKNHFAPGTKPRFPLLMHGETRYTGWDCYGYWAIDADGQPFADFGAHGCSLRPCTVDDLIAGLKAADHDDGAGERVRAWAGRKRELPGWMRVALSFGWTPPAGFNREDYE